ncbi:hypothetical protein B0H17DRAFT_1131797 [Mycena rosella]|uniref:Uncharacterized protein n=1 Tax=Mycena rosella TaxID=1033263 RepID=A0AAD7GHF4_MYCRO|nr:hypothetical protein B0H17DRAFT_1131797 [Mycena rosella]
MSNPQLVHRLKAVNPEDRQPVNSTVQKRQFPNNRTALRENAYTASTYYILHMLPDKGNQYLNTTLCIETISVAPRADSVTRDVFRGLINIEHNHVIHTVHATSEAGTLIAKHGPLRGPCQKSGNIYRLASSFRWTADGGEHKHQLRTVYLLYIQTQAKANGKRAAYSKVEGQVVISVIRFLADCPAVQCAVTAKNLMQWSRSRGGAFFWPGHGHDELRCF